MVTLLYFAWLRERIGLGSETLPLPPDTATIGAVVAWLACRGEGYGAAFAEADRVRCAVNQRMAVASTPVADGDEVAFFPPMTGG